MAKVVGILGGMGPMATVETFRRIVVATEAPTDQDHLHVVVDSDPSVPDRTAALLFGGPDPLPTMQASAQRLVAAGAQVICLPCNTAHAYHAQLQAVVAPPIVHMVEMTADQAAIRGGPCGLLATRGTVASGVYADALHRRGVRLLTPGDRSQDGVDRAIRLVKAGGPALEAAAHCREAVGNMVDAGIDCIVLGCTEISLLPSHVAGGVPTLDALQVLVDATVALATADESSVSDRTVPGPRVGV